MSEVYLANTRCGPNRGMLVKLSELCQKVGLKGIVEERDFVAVKTSFGEA